MTSILKVSEIQDPTNSNTALTIDSSGNVGSLTISSGALTNADNLHGHTYHPISRTDAQTSSVWQTSITTETTGSFSPVTSYGYPSGVKAIFCSGFIQQDGFSSSNGADHASYHFGQSIPDGQYTSSGNIATTFDAQFSFTHDGEGASTGDHGEYGNYYNGLVPVNSDGKIYYRLGHGFSGGTHYISLIMNGYII